MRLAVTVVGLFCGVLLLAAPFLTAIPMRTLSVTSALGLVFLIAGAAARKRPGLSALLLLAAGGLALLLQSSVVRISLLHWAIVAFALAGLSAWAWRRQRPPQPTA